MLKFDWQVMFDAVTTNALNVLVESIRAELANGGSISITNFPHGPLVFNDPKKFESWFAEFEVKRVISALEDNGLRVEGKDLLIQRAASAIDWREELVNVVKAGRKNGISLFYGQSNRATIDIAFNMSETLELHGFNMEQRRGVVQNIQVASSA